MRLNKKQLVILWAIGISSAVLLFRGLRVYEKPIYLRLLNEYSHGGWKPTAWSYLAVVLIVGGLLLYTLKRQGKINLPGG